VRPAARAGSRCPWRAGLQRPIPGRSRHSRAAASPPASLPVLTVFAVIRSGNRVERKIRYGSILPGIDIPGA
jgi:hypothetical protein